MIANATQKQFEGFLQSEPILVEESELVKFEAFALNTGLQIKNFTHQLRKNLMLGKRVEHYFKHYLKNYTQYTITNENIQVFEGTRTIGELDYLVKKDKQHYHIELAYKFYLFDPNHSTEELENWIGPNKNDSLLKKVNKLANKQFPLLKTQAAIDALQLTRSEIEKHRQLVCFLGQLFIPEKYKDFTFKDINPKAIRGYYYSYPKFCASNHDDQRYYMPEKQNWLALPNQHTNWLTFNEIDRQVKSNLEQKKSTLLWSKHQSGKTHSMFITWW